MIFFTGTRWVYFEVQWFCLRISIVKNHASVCPPFVVHLANELFGPGTSPTLASKFCFLPGEFLFAGVSWFSRCWLIQVTLIVLVYVLSLGWVDFQVPQFADLRQVILSNFFSWRFFSDQRFLDFLFPAYSFGSGSLCIFGS